MPGAKVDRVEKVIKALHEQGRFAREADRTRVRVGYDIYYAIYVHENLTSHHPVGQAKFLEQPARTMARELSAIVTQKLRSGGTTAAALMAAGLRLKEASQELCPIDTGALRRSAFVRLEGGVFG